MQIKENLKHIHKQIIAAEQQFARTAGAVKLLAVSKSQSVEKIQQAIAAGQLAFGENYVKEALLKITTLNNKNIEWHFIGAIQSNKTQLIAEHFHWVHSLDNLHHAEQLNAQRSEQLPQLNICIQVNIDQEATKGGIVINELKSFAKALQNFSRLKLRGLMTIPAPQPEFAVQRKSFHKLNLALQTLLKEGLELDTLSMGMTNDYLAAIAEGATIIRIGTAVFGERNRD